jgi:hypothetical protein
MNTPRRFRSAAAYVLLAAFTVACGGGGDGITVSGGAVTSLQFTAQPGNGTAGASFTVVVELLTSNGKRATSATDLVTLSVSGVATLSGNTTQAAIAGVATFSSLTISRAGSGYQITATVNGITSTPSNAFTVVAGAASAAQTSVALSATSITTNTNVTATFTFKDALGNPQVSKTVSLTASLAGATFTPSSGTTGSDGTFAATFRATTTGSATITATVDGTQLTISAPFTVIAPTPAPSITGVSPSSVTGSAIAQSLQILGANFVSGGSVTLRDVTNNSTLTNRTITAFSTTSITISQVFGTPAATWSAQVLNPDGQSSNVFTFAVTAAAADPCTPVALTFPGVKTGAITSASCAANSLPSDFYRFTATGTTAVRFDLTSTFTSPGILTTGDPAGANGIIFGGATAGTAAGEWLLPAGTFLTRVISTSGNGTYTLTGTATPLTGTVGANGTACYNRGLVVSVTLTQALATTDCPYGDGTFFDAYPVASTKPCTITMTSSVVRPFLEVHDGANLTTVITSASGAGTPSVATVSLNQCQTSGGAPVSIWANSFTTPAITGAYTLTLTITGGGAVVDGPPPPTSFILANPRLSLSVPVGVPPNPLKRRQ